MYEREQSWLGMLRAGAAILLIIAPAETLWGQASTLGLTPQEEAIVDRLDKDQLEAFIEGREPSELILDDGTTLAEALKSLGSFAAHRFSIGGGGAGMGPTFSMRGSVSSSGQGNLTDSSTFQTRAGFWTESDVMFTDGFESGDTSFWTGG